MYPTNFRRLSREGILRCSQNQIQLFFTRRPAFGLKAIFPAMEADDQDLRMMIEIHGRPSPLGEGNAARPRGFYSKTVQHREIRTGSVLL